MNLFIRSFSHTHALSIFHRLPWCIPDVLRELADLQSCNLFAKYLSFFLGILLQDPASKVSFWTLLAFILFQSSHISFFSVSPQLCNFSSSCCVWCQWCVYVCCCCLLCVSCFFKHARMNLSWSFDVVLWISHSLHLLNFRNCLTGFVQNV